MKTQRNVKKSQCIGFASNVFPKVQKLVLAENSQTGRALSGTTSKFTKEKPKEVSHWYACRVANGHEKMAYDYLVEQKRTCRWLTKQIEKLRIQFCAGVPRRNDPQLCQFGEIVQVLDVDVKTLLKQQKSHEKN